MPAASRTRPRCSPRSAAVAPAHDNAERRRRAAADRGGDPPARVHEAREVDAAVRERALVHRDDRGAVRARRHGQAPGVRVVGVQRGRSPGADGPEPRVDRAGGVGGHPRRPEGGVGARLRRDRDAEGDRARDPPGPRRLGVVPGEAAVEQPLRPAPPRGGRLELARRRDAHERLLHQRELLLLVQALEAVARVPARVAAVRPVAGDRAADPLAQQAQARGGRSRHPRRAGLRVEPAEAEDDVRVLRGVDVHAVRGRFVRQVVEAQPRAEIPRAAAAAPDVRQEPLEVRGRAAREGRPVAGHRRVAGEHEHMPVELVEADRRPPPVRAGGDAMDPVADEADRARREPQRAARAVCVREPVDDVGVDDQVLLPAAGLGDPARRVALLVAVRRQAVGEDRRRGQPPHDRPRAGVGPRRPAVPVLRGDGVHEQLVRVHHGLGEVAARPVAAGARVPARVEADLEAVGEGEISRVAERRDAGGRTGRAHGR